MFISLISLQVLCEEDLCQVVAYAVYRIGVCNLLMQFYHWYYKYMPVNLIQSMSSLCNSFKVDFGFQLPWDIINATITTICQNPVIAPAQSIMSDHSWSKCTCQGCHETSCSRTLTTRELWFLPSMGCIWYHDDEISSKSPKSTWQVYNGCSYFGTTKIESCQKLFVLVPSAFHADSMLSCPTWVLCTRYCDIIGIQFSGGFRLDSIRFNSIQITFSTRFAEQTKSWRRQVHENPWWQ